MKAFILALVALAAISYGANYALMTQGGFSAAERNTGSAVRLD